MTLRRPARIVLGLLVTAILAAAFGVNLMLDRCAAENAEFRLYPWGCQPLPRIHLERGLKRT
jgi:hypothetical protein